VPGKLKPGRIKIEQAMPPSLDATYPTLIVKAGRGVIHHGALAVARTLGRLGVPIYAVVEDAFTPLGTSRYLKRAFVWESWPSDADSFLRAMSTIAAFIARPTIIIPMDDLSAVFVAENAARLAPWFIVPRVAPHLPRRLANKSRLHDLCAEIGMPLVRSIVPNSIDDVRMFADSAGFPVVAKTTEQWSLLNDRFSTKVIRTPEQLLEFYDGCNHENRSRLIVQEWIPGEDWVSHGYYNSECNISTTFTGKKLRSYPADAGSTALGVSLGNETLRCETERLLKAVGYSGIVDIDWRKDARDGKYKVLDCNPRVGQNFRMFQTSTGIDVVRALHLDLSGRRIDDSPMLEGRLFTVESFNLLASLRRPPWRALKPNAGRRMPRNSKELAWWCSDDPLPSFVMCVRLFARALGQALRRTRNLDGRAVRLATRG
jgi:D-aspartate ligase